MCPDISHMVFQALVILMSSACLVYSFVYSSVYHFYAPTSEGGYNFMLSFLMAPRPRGGDRTLYRVHSMSGLGTCI